MLADMGAVKPADARLMLRGARMGALGTLDRASTGPFVSLVNIGTDFCGFPVLLLSRLARHTGNLLSDRRASLLATVLPQGGDALTGSRVTLVGQVEALEKADAAPRYLAQHPDATMYVEFADFSFWRMIPVSVHCVAGFGRIETFEGVDVFLRLGEYATLAAQAPKMVEESAGAEVGGWRIVAIDPDGADVMNDSSIKRVTFASSVNTEAEWRESFRIAGAQFDEKPSQL